MITDALIEENAKLRERVAALEAERDDWRSKAGELGGYVTTYLRERDELRAKLAAAETWSKRSSLVGSDVLAELQAKLNHESYVSDKRAVERDNAERERDRLTEKVAALEAENAELKKRIKEDVEYLCWRCGSALDAHHRCRMGCQP